jgi:hypothetical protein
MHIKSYIFILISCFSFSLFAAEADRDKVQGDNYRMRLASKEDIPAIVELMNTQAYKDSAKIVIVPEKFREEYAADAIQHERLFVASDAHKIVGYKKLFCITDDKELDEILNVELRCLGTKPAGCCLLDCSDRIQHETTSEKAMELFSHPVTYVYTGADFTHQDYRSKGLNTYLTQYALDWISKSTVDDVLSKKSSYLALVYGLTHSNAGSRDDLLGGRTSSIIKQFIPFASKIAVLCNQQVASKMLLSRYPAYKPSFDPKAVECRPLPSAKEDEGFGCVIACTLEPKSARVGTA